MALVIIEAVNDEVVTACPGHRQQAGQDAGDLHEPRERVACQAFYQDDVQHCNVFVLISKAFSFKASCKASPELQAHAILRGCAQACKHVDLSLEGRFENNVLIIVT